MIFKKRSFVYFSIGMTIAAGFGMFLRRKKRRRRIMLQSEEHPKVVVDCQNVLGEGVVWDPKEGAVYWVDIEGKTLHQYLPDHNGAYRTWVLPKRPGSIALACDGRMLIAFEDGFVLYDLETRDMEPIEAPYQQVGMIRLNDGKTDRQGRFICGGFNGEDEGTPEWKPACSVYQVGLDLSVREILDFKVKCANSICFSPDGDKMYFTDSPSREILVFDYDGLQTFQHEVMMPSLNYTVTKLALPNQAPSSQKTGNVSNRRVFACVPEPGLPDGSTCDSEGYLWNAEWGSGRVVRYTPDGKVDRVVHVPTASRLTCPAFGGSELRTLYITSASVGLTLADRQAEPAAGALFALELKDVKGIEETRFGELEEVYIEDEEGAFLSLSDDDDDMIKFE